MTTESSSPYESACEAYEKHMKAGGWLYCEKGTPLSKFDVAHSEAIGAAVEAAVLAERARIIDAINEWRMNVYESVVNAVGEEVHVVTTTGLYSQLEKLRSET